MVPVALLVSSPGNTTVPGGGLSGLNAWFCGATSRSSRTAVRPISAVDKYQVRMGVPRYAMAVYLRSLPQGTRVLTSDILIAYHADGMNMVVGGYPSDVPPPNVDYLLLTPSDPRPTWVEGQAPAHIEGEYQLFKVP